MYRLGMSTRASRARRRNRAVALREQGLSTRQIAGRLGVSQPTAWRDLKAHEQAEAEAVLAALRGDRPAPKRRPVTIDRREIRGLRWKRYERDLGMDANLGRWLAARWLRSQGMSVREIGKALGVSPATAWRELRREERPRLPPRVIRGIGW
jgi:transposase